MGFAKVFHFFLFRHLGPHGTFMTFVGEPKFSISSSFSSTWRYTEFYMPELCHMCKDGYTRCWKFRLSLRHVGRHSTRYWQHTCHRRFHPPLGTPLTQEHTGDTGANAMAICPSRCCVPSGTRCWHILFRRGICPLVIYHKRLVAVVVKSKH